MSSASAAVDVAEAFADAAQALGVGPTGEDVARELAKLLDEPLRLFLEHPNWPTGMVGFQSPFELSVSISKTGPPSLRFIHDATDHRVGLTGNWHRYLDRSLAVTCAPEQELHDLQMLLLDGSGPLFRSRMTHGVNHLAEGRRSGTLYFQTRWLSLPAARRRLPSAVAAVEALLDRTSAPRPPSFDFIAYDLADHHPPKIKLYAWCRFDEDRPRLVDAVGHNEHLLPLQDLIDLIGPRLAVGPPGGSVLIQYVPDADGGCAVRTQLPTPGWPWSEPAALAKLLAHLEQRDGFTLDPLHQVLECFTRRKLALRSSVVSLGWEAGKEVAGFYFYPQLDRHVRAAATRHRPAREAPTVRDVTRRAVDFLLAGRTDGTYWRDLFFDGPDEVWIHHGVAGPLDEWTTTYVCACLADAPEVRERLTGTADWLAAARRPAGAWGWHAANPPDAETTALALLALAGLGCPLGDEALAPFHLAGGGVGAFVDQDVDHEHGAGAPELSALALLAAVRAGAAGSEHAERLVLTLLHEQRDEGGWNAFWWIDDLMATWRAAVALRAWSDAQPGPLADAAAQAIRRANPSVQALPVGRSALGQGLWLCAWFATGGDPRHPSVGRILNRLAWTQHEDGHWAGGPVRRLAGDSSLRPWGRKDTGIQLVDRHGFVTTATVVAGLRSATAALP